MEFNRYWLLALGLLLVFFGSRTGFFFLNSVYNIIRTGFYLTLALIFAVAAKIMWVVSHVLFVFGNLLRRMRGFPPVESLESLATASTHPDENNA